MLLFLLYLAFPPQPDTTGLPVNWNGTSQWKIYALNNSSKVFSIPTDSVRAMDGVPLADDSVRVLLQSAKLLHVPMSPAWMGCYLTTCKNEEGQFMKIVVSQYGGFFLNSYDGNYYQLDATSTRLWLDYMRRAYIKTE